MHILAPFRHIHYSQTAGKTSHRVSPADVCVFLLFSLSLSFSFLSIFIRSSRVFSLNNSPRCLSQSPLEVLSLKATFISPVFFSQSSISQLCDREKIITRVSYSHTLSISTGSAFQMPPRSLHSLYSITIVFYCETLCLLGKIAQMLRRFLFLLFSTALPEFNTQLGGLSDMSL